ncbi:MAG: acyl-CoA dehydrogenase family protein [Acidimicrobiia bacterium]|nr:acyl-CoA dehydrogenase family protein [Acidimicrobiia bacterium]
MRARRDGDHFVLDGTKIYITNGSIADDLLVVARTDGEPGRLRGLSVLLVDGETPGLTRSPMRKVGMRAADLGELHFDGCVVEADRLVGEENTGFRECLTVLSQGRIFGGALACGLGRAALDATISHAMTREQFGAPLAALQAVRFNVADMAARLAAARTLVYRAAAALAGGHPYETDASIAKLVASECATWMAERAMHLHGAAGFMVDSPVQRYYRDCKILEYGEGTNEVQREMIFEALVAGYRP